MRSFFKRNRLPEDSQPIRNTDLRKLILKGEKFVLNSITFFLFHLIFIDISMTLIIVYPSLRRYIIFDYFIYVPTTILSILVVYVASRNFIKKLFCFAGNYILSTVLQIITFCNLCTDRKPGTEKLGFFLMHIVFTFTVLNIYLYRKYAKRRCGSSAGFMAVVSVYWLFLAFLSLIAELYCSYIILASFFCLIYAILFVNYCNVLVVKGVYRKEGESLNMAIKLYI